MTITSGISKKGTIWIRNFDNKGRLLQKRVCRHDNMQFDTAFHPRSGNPAYMLITNWADNSQFLHLYTKKSSFLGRFFAKFIPKSKFSYSNLHSMVNMDHWMQKGVKGQFAVGFYQASTGFANPDFNKIANNLKSDYLSKIFK